MPRHTFRSINRALGKHAPFGPFPAELLLPLVAVTIIAYLGYAFLGLSWIQAGFVGAFLLATWWLLTGGSSFRYVSRFSRWFKPKWIRSAQIYTPWTLDTHDTNQTKTKNRRARPPF